MRLLTPLGLLGFLTVAAAVGQEPAPPADAAKPSPVPTAFRSLLVVDDRYPAGDARNRQDKMHCLVCENGLSPVVAVFARNVPAGVESPVGKLLVALEPQLDKYRGDRMAAFAVFLRTEAGTKEFTVKPADGGAEVAETADKEFPDDERTKEPDPKAPPLWDRETEQKAIKAFADESRKVVEAARKAYADANKTTLPPGLHIPYGLAATKSKVSDAFGITDDADVTVVVYNRLSVYKRWSLKEADLTDEKIKEILAATDDVVTGKK